MDNWSEHRILWLIVALSVLLRVGAALYLGDSVVALPGTHDQISYDALAQNVAAGKGFVFDEFWYPFTPPNTPTAHWSFLYTLYLAAVYAIVGHYPLVVRLVQAVVVGVSMPLLVYSLGKRSFGRQVGLAGAAAIAVYIYLVYYSASLMTEAFYIVALLWSLDLLQRIGHSIDEQTHKEAKGGARKWISLGIALGLATLLRQQALILIPVFALWLVWATWKKIDLWTLAKVALVPLFIVVLFILPWTLRNYRVYDQFLPLNSNVGYALYAANHPQQGKRFEPLNLPSIPREWYDLNEAELNNRLTIIGIRFVVEDPGRFALQTLDRFRNYFRFWPTPESSPMANLSRVLSFGLYLPFMILGLLLSLRQVRRPPDSSPHLPKDVALLYLFAASYSAIHLLSWAMHRYRLPVDAVMMVFVGLAWVFLYRRFKNWLMARLAKTKQRQPSSP